MERAAQEKPNLAAAISGLRRQDIGPLKAASDADGMLFSKPFEGEPFLHFLLNMSLEQGFILEAINLAVASGAKTNPTDTAGCSLKGKLERKIAYHWKMAAAHLGSIAEQAVRNAVFYEQVALMLGLSAKKQDSRQLSGMPAPRDSSQVSGAKPDRLPASQGSQGAKIPSQAQPVVCTEGADLPKGAAEIITLLFTYGARTPHEIAHLMFEIYSIKISPEIVSNQMKLRELRRPK